MILQTRLLIAVITNITKKTILTKTRLFTCIIVKHFAVPQNVLYLKIL